MPVLDLLGISDESFDGRSIDKDIGAIQRLSSNKYGEDEIESANAALEEINDLVWKISSFEQISDSYDQLVGCVDTLYMVIANIKMAVLNNNTLDDLIDDIEDATDRVNNLEVNPYGLQHKLYDMYFEFIPKTAIYAGCYTTGVAAYSNKDWVYHNHTKSPKLFYKEINFVDCVNKIKSSGFDPNNMTKEDVEFMKMVDNQGSEVYDLFISKI